MSSKTDGSIAPYINTNVTTRWDSTIGAWAIVAKNGSSFDNLAVIERATLVNVTFQVLHMPDARGCTPGGYVGLAHGKLLEYVPPPATAQLLSFTETSFTDPNTHAPLERCDALYLLGDRRAVWENKAAVAAAAAPAAPLAVLFEDGKPVTVCPKKKVNPLARQISLITAHAAKFAGGEAEPTGKRVLADDAFTTLQRLSDELGNHRITSSYNILLAGMGESRKLIVRDRDSGRAAPYYPQGTLLFLTEDRNSHGYPKDGKEPVLVYNGKTGRALYRRPARGNAVVAGDNSYNADVSSYAHRLATPAEIDAWVEGLTAADYARLNSSLPDLMAAVQLGQDVKLTAEGSEND